MIQRVQSIWLLIVALAAFATYTLTLYVGTVPDGSKKIFQLADDFLLTIFIIAIGILAIVNLFLFKNRKLQLRLSILGIFLSAGFTILEYYRIETFKKNAFIESGSYQPGALLPLVMIVFFFMAARGIYKDQKLIRSMDRLR